MTETIDRLLAAITASAETERRIDVGRHAASEPAHGAARVAVP